MEKIDKIRGSIDVPLDANGIKQAEAAGKRFKEGGGVQVVAASSLRRAARTGQKIVDQSPGAAFFLTKSLHPWRLGEFEGQATSEVLPKILKLMDTPGKKAPGRSPQSTEDGESFDEFRERFLTYFNKARAIMKENPKAKMVLCVHYRCIKLIQAYAKHGANPKSMDIKLAHMSSQPRDDEKPGSIFYFNDNPKHPSLEPTKNTKTPGIYVIRHGETSLNGGPS